jgi:hypothetical protein
MLPEAGAVRADISFLSTSENRLLNCSSPFAPIQMGKNKFKNFKFTPIFQFVTILDICLPPFITILDIPGLVLFKSLFLVQILLGSNADARVVFKDLN